MRRTMVIATVMALLAGGCSKEYMARGPGPAAASPAEAPAAAPGSGKADKPEGKTFKAADAVKERKIIRTAELEVESEDLNADLAKISARAVELGGYVASSSKDASVEAQSRAKVVVKVPAERFEELMKFLASGFKVERESTDAQDITEEYIDVEARLKNARLEETRLLEILATKTGKIEEVLAVERELARVRENIEVMEGKLRFFDNRVGLSTVTIELRHDKALAPVSGSWTRALGRDLRDSFGESIRLFGRSLRALLLVVVVLAPWAVVAAIIIFILVKLIRRRRLPRG